MAIYRTGVRYEGGFEKNKPSGDGIQLMTDGSKYIGQFHKGMKNGKGTYYSPGGQILEEGNWDDDKCSSEGDGLLDVCEWIFKIAVFVIGIYLFYLSALSNVKINHKELKKLMEPA